MSGADGHDVSIGRPDLTAGFLHTLNKFPDLCSPTYRYILSRQAKTVP